MSSNEYMRIYMLDRYYRRKEKAIAALGGVCAKCGAAAADLQFDHIDPATKKFTLGKGLATWSEVRIQEELSKCQLLCQSCHTKKTLVDLGQVSARETHGTLSSYKYCKCDLCRGAWNAYSKECKRKSRAKRRAEKNNTPL